MAASQSRPSDPGSSGSAAAHTAKLALRDQLLAGRRRRPLIEVADAGRILADLLLDAVEVRRAATVAAYASVGGEPGTTLLLERLLAAGRRVLLPVLLPDGDLDWAAYTGALSPARRGLLEPPGPRLGVEAVSGADVVLVPGLAVSPTGLRLGRGGGSYDRALTRVAPGTFTCVLLYDDEVGLDVPAEPHDRVVSAVVAPGGLRRFGGFDSPPRR